jgi:transcriptional regulator GlxA family with amidase domain
VQAVLQLIDADPGKRLTTQWLAAHFNVTERTLERRCIADLGIGLGEWQQRIRFMRALARLDAGQSVKRIASELGYASPSVFINMFRGIAGETPHQYRLGNAEGGAARFAAAPALPQAQAAERNDTR